VPPPVRAEEGTDRQASLAYEPVAGYDASPRHPGRLAPTTGALMGTHSHDSTQIEPEEQGIVKLEEALGRKMDINNHYHGGWEDIAEDGLSWLEYWDVENGRIPLVGWGCHDSNKIISGAEDDVIRRTAQQMKAFGHEFFMRYCWEMDGSRKQGTVKGPDRFNEAWRRMHRIFQEEGATNVIWTWTANAAGFKDKRRYTNNEPPGPYFYPGDEYVDWIAADGYNWGVSKRNQGDRWRQVLEIFDEFMVFARAHPKPIMIGEYGAQEQDEDPEAKPEWMRHAHDVLINKPKTPDCKHCGAFSDVAAVVYFDVDYGSHGDWRIMSSEQSLLAFKEASDDPWFHQMDNVSWPPKLNRTQPNRASEYGPRRSPDDSSQSNPPPDQAGPPPDQAPEPEPANEPEQAGPPPDQAGPPPEASQPEPANQPDQGGQPPDEASQPEAKAQKPESGRKGKKNR
jgi:beta-mannanase